MPLWASSLGVQSDDRFVLPPPNLRLSGGSGHLDPGTLDHTCVLCTLLGERHGVGRTGQFGLEDTKLFECSADFGDLADRDKLFNELLHDVGRHVGGADPAECRHQFEAR